MYLLKLIAAYSVLPATISSFHSPHRHVISSDNYRSSRTAKKATEDNLFWPSTPSPVDNILVSDDEEDDNADDDNILDLALDSVVKIYATHR